MTWLPAAYFMPCYKESLAIYTEMNGISPPRKREVGRLKPDASADVETRREIYLVNGATADANGHCACARHSCMDVRCLPNVGNLSFAYRNSLSAQLSIFLP